MYLMLPQGIRLLSGATASPLTRIGFRRLFNVSNSRPLTTFSVLGTGSLLKVSLAPSTPLYTRRNSFVASFGQLDSIISTLHISRLVTRLLSWQRPFALQKLISTTPVETLISCSQSTSFTVLELDGTIDWIISSSNALHTYTGESLVIIPRTKWRVRRGSPLFDHTFITGRGSVALAASGHTYKVVLQEKESVLINKESLVAYSVDSNNLNSALPRPLSLLHTFNTGPADSRWARFKNWASRFMRADPNKFYKLHGPSTLLLQSQVPSLDVFKSVKQSLTGQIGSPSKLETEVHNFALETTTKQEQDVIDARTSGLSGGPRDHFKVATVSNGRVLFETTDNFKEFR
jgi:hypothetical protein